MKTVITWRFATEDEIKKGLDDPENPRMFKVDERQVEETEEPETVTLEELMQEIELLKQKQTDMETKVDAHDEFIKEQPKK